MNPSETNSLNNLPASATAEPSAAAVFPLSAMQESVWLSEQLTPDSAMWNLAQAWRLRGPLDPICLQQSLNQLTRRHETLRTVFRVQKELPAQLVLESKPFDFTCAKINEPELTTAVSTTVRETFSLSRGPLARARLLRLQDNEHVLVICLHHIISDEWSMRVFAAELAELYAANASGRKPTLPHLAIQYGDFAVWHRGQLASQKVASDLEFWRNELQKPLPETSVPGDRAGQTSHAAAGRTDFVKVPAALVGKLKDVGRECGATLFMTLLAAFKTLIYRYSQQTDQVLGTPVAGRDQIETEHLVGLLVNTLPVRTRLVPDHTFRQLLATVRENVLRANAHRAASTESIIGALHLDRCGRRHPLFRTVFGLQPALANPWTKTGLEANLIEVDNEEAKFDWTLLATETAEGLSLRSEYDLQKYSSLFMAQALRQFESLLHEITANLDRQVSRLPLFSSAERDLLLNSGKGSCPVTQPQISGNSLQLIFEEQAARTPAATALTLDDRHWTYQQLNERANQIAALLLERGVGPETRVALFLDRSAETVMAILAVLKAGGTYIPLDAATPAERARFILQDSAARFLVTRSDLGDCLACAVSETVFLDKEESAINTCSPENPLNRTVPEHAAYVIYTSGSTGKPKGVLVTHQNVIRLFQQTEPWFRFRTDDVWTLFHSYSFDFSVWEMWGALLYGGRLVIVPYLVSRSPKEFLSLLALERITVLNQTPSAFRQLIWAEANSPAQKLSLRFVIFGGEALELKSLKPWFERHGDSEPTLVNMYGITETTVHVTYRVIRAVDLEANAGSVIGVPIPDLNLYLLDQHLEPVPLGVAGEIFVGGAGVASGYLNRPELTASRFLPDPFSSTGGARMYRSGDLARRTVSGELEYLGRIDQQVKIRGFRIEIGEIESALNTHPLVRESVVIPDQNGPGDKRLVAYVVPRNGVLDVQSLRADLARQLPDYMVPSVILPIPTMPLNQNGKIDRSNLPRASEAAQLPSATAPPETQTEKAAHHIWSELLGTCGFGIDDNFFSLGGHSLMATQVTARLEQECEIEVPLQWMFETPTIRALARQIDAAPRRQGGSRIPIPRRSGADRAEDLLSRIDQLSDEEVERLLGEESSSALSS